MRTPHTTASLFVAALSLAPNTALLQADELHQFPVDQRATVVLRDSQLLRGQLDERSSSRYLWLRFGNDATVIRRRLRWQDVATIYLGTQVVAPGELRKSTAKTNKTAESEVIAAPTPVGTPASPTPPGTANTSPVETEPAENQTRLDESHHSVNTHPCSQPSCTLDVGPTSPLRQLQFDAHLANWDNDLEADGLTVTLIPIGVDGRLTPVTGTLHVELVARKLVPFEDVPHGRGQPLRELASWTRPVSGAHLTPRGLLVKLPFLSENPQFDTRWADQGVVRLRFVVPGVGVFARSIDSVRIRPFAPIRDALEQQKGQRFSPRELAGY